MKKSKNRWYYVSYYEEYPIYEPAEGGYYYAETELHYFYRVRTLKKARRILNKVASELGIENMCKNRAYEAGKHIGDGRSLRIETVLGIAESGYRHYE